MIDHRPSSYNRSFYERPIQGNGRDAFDYGRVSFKRPRDPWTKPVLIGAVVVVLYFVAQILRSAF